MSYQELDIVELQRGVDVLRAEKEDCPRLNTWTASALAANDVVGGIFYSLPPVVAVAGVL